MHQLRNCIKDFFIHADQGFLSCPTVLYGSPATEAGFRQ